ncbi:sigma-70 family RNA polymerase sigma factor [Polaribacter sp.]|jgi:RNA polymerase sigma factor (sigma-70 family)|nr:sigma-70 family RNA polymerase sigma factor [Polaribacter sp.]
MKKYNIKNYIRYKDDLERSMPEEKEYVEYTRDELIVRFMPLVENLARKFSTADQASGVLDITDLIQEGCMGLIRSVDRLNWETLNDSEDIEKTLKSFLSKRIKGSIRRAIDVNRGDVRIPEHKLNEIRKNPEDDKMVSLFFNSIFTSYDEYYNDEENPIFQVEDDSKPYNIALLNTYLLGLMREYLNEQQYEVLRLSFGLDCDKMTAKQVANKLKITVSTANVRISQIKKEAIDSLIANVKPDQVIDYL